MNAVNSQNATPSEERNTSRDFEEIFTSNDIQVWRKQLVYFVLRFAVVLGAVALLPAIYSEYAQGAIVRSLIYFAFYGVLLAVTFLPRIPYQVQVVTLGFCLYGLAIVSYVIYGWGGSGSVFLLGFSILMALLVGKRGGFLALGLSIASVIGMGWVYYAGYRTISIESLASYNRSIYLWVSSATVLLMLAGMNMRLQGSLLTRLMEALGDMRHLADALDTARASLEERVRERTYDLERRARYMQATTGVAHEATQLVEDPQVLLQHVVSLISQQFGFYHAAIFLLDRTGEWAVMQAASSIGGQRMLARQHRLQVGEQGTVGYVTAHGVPRIALNVGEDAVFFDNPDLPETRSVITLPLNARGEIIGALDVQSREAAAFSDEDVEVLQTLADQVAIAISNAYLFRQVQQSVVAERRARGEQAREAWRELLRTEPHMGFLSDLHGITPVAGDEWDAEMVEALNTGTTVVGDEAVALALPIRSRGQVVGVIDAHLPTEAEAWSSEQVSLLEALAAQVGTALESAQLYRETQRRATRERLTREITDALQRAVDVESLMRIAAEELNRNLRGSRAYVRLDVATSEADADQDDGGEADATE